MGSFTGAQLAALLPGVQSFQSRFINFFSDNSLEEFDSVILNNPNVLAFEVDNVAYWAIPTPALLPGLLAVGAGILRKRKADTQVEADAEA